MKDFEIKELDEKDLMDVAGGMEEEEDGGTNTNCGCNGREFSGEPGANNENCGC